MKFENTEAWGFEHAMRGMRNPKNSWNRSDSRWVFITDDDNIDDNIVDFKDRIKFVIGKNDMKLAQTLIKAGNEHRKFMRQIFVSVDITAPMYVFQELDTYKVGTVANSTSKMHKLASTPITMDCFEIDDYNDVIVNEGEFIFEVDTAWYQLIDVLEELRQKYIETKDKRLWKELIRLLPESWLQKRTITMNYENIYSMIHQRKYHKLNEWSGIDNPKLPNFIAWARTLPYAKELLFIDELEEKKGEQT